MDGDASGHDEQNQQSRRRPQESADAGRSIRWLALGAAGGLALAAASLVTSGDLSSDSLPADAVARVNNTLIRSDDYQRLVAGLESDRRNPIDDDMRRHVLDRMIDEELLVQRALDLGLAQVDRRVRGDLTSSIIASVVSAADEGEPDEDELREFLDENRDFFTVPGRLRVRQVFFRVRGSDAEEAVRERATAALGRLEAGEAFDTVREELGDNEISRLPDVLLPLAKLREYLGPTAQRAAGELELGAWSQPVRSGTGIHLLQLVEREPPRVPTFEEGRASIAAEWKRRGGDRALREYLDDLRDDAEVVTAPTLR